MVVWPFPVDAAALPEGSETPLRLWFYPGRFFPTLTLTDEAIREEATEQAGGNCQQPGHYIEDPALQGELQPQRWPGWHLASG